MTRRDQIMDIIAAALSQIRVANGWLTDIGANVRHWPPLNIPIAEDTLLLRDIEEDVEDPGSNLVERELRVTAVAVRTGDNARPTGLRAALADLTKRLAQLSSELPLSGGHRLAFLHNRIEIAQEELIVGRAELQFVIHHITEREEF